MSCVFFGWKKCDPNRVDINTFTRLVFGLTQPWLILEVTLKVHFHNYLTNSLKVIDNTSDDMYRENLTSGGNIVAKVEILKKKCEELFKKMVSIYTNTSGVLT